MGVGKALDGVGTMKVGWGDKQNALDGEGSWMGQGKGTRWDGKRYQMWGVEILDEEGEKVLEEEGGKVLEEDGGQVLEEGGRKYWS